MLFSRLLKMKELSRDLANTVPRTQHLHPVAVELGLQKEQGIFFVSEKIITDFSYSACIYSKR